MDNWEKQKAFKEDKVMKARSTKFPSVRIASLLSSIGIARELKILKETSEI